MVLAHHVIAARAPGVDVIADGRLEAQISDLARDKGEHDDGAEASAPTPSTEHLTVSSPAWSRLVRTSASNCW
jgi:hypothetical protein